MLFLRGFGLLTLLLMARQIRKRQSEKQFDICQRREARKSPFAAVWILSQRGSGMKQPGRESGGPVSLSKPLPVMIWPPIPLIVGGYPVFRGFPLTSLNRRQTGL